MLINMLQTYIEVTDHGCIDIFLYICNIPRICDSSDKN